MEGILLGHSFVLHGIVFSETPLHIPPFDSSFFFCLDFTSFQPPHGLLQAVFVHSLHSQFCGAPA